MKNRIVPASWDFFQICNIISRSWAMSFSFVAVCVKHPVCLYSVRLVLSIRNIDRALFSKTWASVNQQTIPDQTIVSTTSQVNKDSSPVHYQTMVWWDFFFSLRLKTLTCIISTLFLSFIRPWLPHQTINTFKNKSTCLFSSIRPWSDGLFL